MATTDLNSATNYSEVKIDVNGELKKAAFTVFNRDINKPNVELIAEKMKAKGYRKGEPIQVISTELAENLGIDILIDINEQRIPREKFHEYCMVLDGVHRSHAASLCNSWLIEEGKPEIVVPSIEIDLIDESITEYINEINCTKLEWKKEDYVKGAACVFPKIALLQKYKNLIKRDGKSDGYPLSTLNHIYCGVRGLTKSDLVLLCYGKTKKGKDEKDIIPKHNIEKGDKFIQTCRDVGFKEKDITKRYLITEFKNLKIEEGENFAFQLFEQITKDDRSSMENRIQFLDEAKVIDHFLRMKERLKRRNLESGDS